MCQSVELEKVMAIEKMRYELEQTKLELERQKLDLMKYDQLHSGVSGS